MSRGWRVSRILVAIHPGLRGSRQGEKVQGRQSQLRAWLALSERVADRLTGKESVPVQATLIIASLAQAKKL